MSVATWDGRTKFTINESSTEEKERLEQWEKYLAGGETESEKTEENH